MDKIFSGQMTLLKALAILLVVSGHLEFSIFGMFPPYSFQLALFFFISGMLFKDKYLDNVSEYFTRRIKSLLVPYFAYEAVYLLITIALVPVVGEFLGDTPSLKSFFITPFLNGHQLLLCAPLWFVPQLFMTMITFLFLLRLFRKFDNEKYSLIFFTILGFGTIPLWKVIPHTPLALVVIRTTFSLFFVYLGYYYVKFIKDRYDIFTPKWLGGIILFQSFLWLFNRDFDPYHGIGLSYVLVWGRFDEQLIVPVFTSLTGIWVSLFAVKILYPYLKDVKLLQDIGNSTYHIMANHLFVMYIITSLLFHYADSPILLKITGSHVFTRGDKIYSIFDPVQMTYLYFVIVVLSTTYLAKLQRFLYKKIFPQKLS